MITLDATLVEAAQEGSRNALEELVGTVQRPVFNLAIRMLGHAADAEDATQEILIKVITHLGDVREPGAAGAWAFRIACRHLVHTRRRGMLEAHRFTFRTFASDLEDGLEELPDEEAKDVETQAMIEEIKIGCTLALLTCLSRGLRAAYILGEIFELSDTEAASALEIEAAAFRQRLRRARSSVSGFVQSRCGIVSTSAKCRCERRVAQAERLGRVEKGKRCLPTTDSPPLSIAAVRAEVERLERDRAAAALMRSNPSFTTDVGRLVMDAIGAEREH
jgi:RNA polymerase sigma factor (sigma-70 family)